MKPQIPLVIACVALLGLTACAPGTQTVVGGPRATTGVVTGALVGAAIGANASGGNRLAQAATGAVLGGALGGVIGATLDRQAADLQASVSNQTRVVNNGNSLTVTMPQDILFATNSAALRPDLLRDLDALATNLLNYPDSTIEIVGHTDNTGTAALNQDLSQRRAGAVADKLRTAGVPSRRIVAIGRGEDFPVASNLTPEGRALNRRVEMVIRPTT
ncbi:MAG: OmpA family protein [Rhodobacter sp.]|nr:OmpA family protein [Rhodobacter sp.]MCA3519444.1 OmpA family protein [Rhodobacter sp.]MCA3521736.1 OmpA family protein [Rhodobacter sp.]MCA3526961.1 OmpA family protein [Rhodobacter sp.]MCA3529230.1 OmpA family protein [Rhodobacter sp.]